MGGSEIKSSLDIVSDRQSRSTSGHVPRCQVEIGFQSTARLLGDLRTDRQFQRINGNLAGQPREVWLLVWSGLAWPSSHADAAWQLVIKLIPAHVFLRPIQRKRTASGCQDEIHVGEKARRISWRPQSSPISRQSREDLKLPLVSNTSHGLALAPLNGRFEGRPVRAGWSVARP